MPTYSVTRLRWSNPGRQRRLRRGLAFGLLTATGLVCSTYGQTARPQTVPGLGAAKPPTPLAISKVCLPEHEKYCPNGKSGTRPDIACLQQHHTSLSLNCRTILHLSPVGGATPATNSEAH